MASERAWVAMLSCGHAIGSKPPPMADVDPPMDSVAAQRMAYAGVQMPKRPAPEPEFVPPPAEGDLVACEACDFDGRWAVDIIMNKDAPLPRLEERRAGTRW